MARCIEDFHLHAGKLFFLVVGQEVFDEIALGLSRDHFGDIFRRIGKDFFFRLGRIGRNLLPGLFEKGFLQGLEPVHVVRMSVGHENGFRNPLVFHYFINNPCGTRPGVYNDAFRPVLFLQDIAVRGKRAHEIARCFIICCQKGLLSYCPSEADTALYISHKKINPWSA